MTSNQRLLEDRYPVLFPIVDGGRWYGLSIGDGWFPIVDKMCAELAALREPPKIVQIKEKFADLRCYTEGGESTEVAEIIGLAAVICEHTCEVCGEDGKKLTIQHYMTVRCGKHSDRVRYD